MNAEELDDLLKRYLQGTCTEEEKIQVEAMVEAYDNESTAWEDLEKTRQKNWLNTVWLDVQQSISVHEAEVFKLRNTFKIYKLAAAAAVLLILSAGIYFYRVNLTGAHQFEAESGAILPGTNKAILTLANGEKIALSTLKTGIVVDGSGLTYNDGTAVSPVIANDSRLRRQFRTEGLLSLNTPRGGQYQISLEDGTRIFLNAATLLKYPSTFAGLKERKVILEGEAYFIVKHNAKQPFRVETKGQLVEDVGTEFNIEAYTDETTTKTTLIEGSALVYPGGSKLGGGQIGGRHSGAARDLNAVALTAGKQSQLKIDGTLQVSSADPEQAIAWKNGEFMFRKETLESIMRKVARWYDVEVIYENKQVGKELFGGTISKFGKVSEVLHMLQLTGDVNFKIEGRRITVMK